MLDFEETFFADEVRENFFVSEEMKRFWAANMEVLSFIAAVCHKYNLQWYMDMGSMLGAVRHKGFIPWDDDIDIGMKRADYQKLMKVLPKELPEGFAIGGPFFCDTYDDFFVGVSNTGHVCIEKEFLEKFHGCPFKATVDIFPMDSVPDNEEEATTLYTLMTLIFSAVGALRREDQEELQEGLVALEEVTGTRFDRTSDLESQLWMLAHLLAASYEEKDGEYLVEWVAYLQNPEMKYHKSWYSEVMWVPFENIFVPIPKGYHDILSTRYGDYMTPVQGTAAHDYPHYEKQREELNRLLEEAKKEE